jgi:hypothetical protein
MQQRAGGSPRSARRAGPIVLHHPIGTATALEMTIAAPADPGLCDEVAGQPAHQGATDEKHKDADQAGRRRYDEDETHADEGRSEQELRRLRKSAIP